MAGSAEDGWDLVNRADGDATGAELIELRVRGVERAAPRGDAEAGSGRTDGRTSRGPAGGGGVNGGGSGSGVPSDAAIGADDPSLLRFPELTSAEVALKRGEMVMTLAQQARELRDALAARLADANLDPATRRELEALANMSLEELVRGDGWSRLDALRDRGALDPRTTDWMNAIGFVGAVDQALENEQKMRDELADLRDGGDVADWVRELSRGGLQWVMAEARALLDGTPERSGDFAGIETRALKDYRTALRQRMSDFEVKGDRATDAELAEIDRIQQDDFRMAAELIARGEQTVLPPVTLSAAARERLTMSVGEQAVELAKRELGKPYVWAAAGPNSFDCSGLMLYVYDQLGISMPHYSGSQYAMFPKVAREDLQPGDLVFFGANIHHVGMYIGNGEYLHAPRTGDVVKISKLDGRSDYHGAARPF